ncbi:hypothetical protein HERIO_2333 [Hepatospora eriocheir]|uniref:Uncharacterized protein n=1 Tax=Hepatospora eriocheir TaxID=1081669 RepID=A0A1X0Q7E8_9MICR|nr:hypothetical protein HERIO_2333 [Hepatospora eriocheir]
MKEYNLKNNFIKCKPLNTPNKNITSFFDKIESCPLVKDIYRYPLYSFPVINVVILSDKIFVIKEVDDLPVKDIIVNEDYSILDKCLYLSDINSFKKYISQLESRNFFIRILFYDWMNRNQKISLIDLIIRELQLKGVMLLPLSFCFHMCHNLYKKSKPNTSGIIKFNDYIYSFLDEYTLADVYVGEESEYYEKFNENPTTGNIDFTEEFSKLKSFCQKMPYICNVCDFRSDSEEKMLKHLSVSRKCNKRFFFYDINDKNNFIKNRLRLLGLKNKIKDNEIIKVELNDDGINKVIKGALLFKETSVAKELWLTDKEWHVGRLKFLKEKILFFYNYKFVFYDKIK